jgi:predicted amidohydrolase
VCGVNKVGVDVGGSTRDHFGSSLVISPRGEILAQASDTRDDIAVGDVDVAALPRLRELWGYYRDRRPDQYGAVVDLPAGDVHPAATLEPAGRRSP